MRARSIRRVWVVDADGRGGGKGRIHDWCHERKEITRSTCQKRCGVEIVRLVVLSRLFARPF